MMMRFGVELLRATSCVVNVWGAVGESVGGAFAAAEVTLVSSILRQHMFVASTAY